MSTERKSLYEFERFRCDPGEHLLFRDGKPISLAPKAFEILLVLIESNGRLLTKEELMQKMWPDTYVEEANLTINISAVRKALGDTSGEQQLIETVPKRGYRFLAKVTEVRHDTESQSTQDSGDRKAANRWTPWTRRAGLATPWVECQWEGKSGGVLDLVGE